MTAATIHRSWTERSGGREVSFAVGQVAGVKWRASSFGGRGGWSIETDLAPAAEAEVRRALAAVGGGRAAVANAARGPFRAKARRIDSLRRQMAQDEAEAGGDADL